MISVYLRNYNNWKQTSIYVLTKTSIAYAYFSVAFAYFSISTKILAEISAPNKLSSIVG